MNNALVADTKSLNALKFQAGERSPAAIKEAAKQLESLFMRELIKSMREATAKSGLTDSAQGDLGTDLFDQQMAVQMSGRPGGLSDAIVRQLTAQMGAAAQPDKLSQATPVPAQPGGSQSQFVQRMNEVASKVEQASGIPASFMIGQAGHESGWGKREIRAADGSNSFNVFGIKATGDWHGKVAEVATTEYVAGQAQTVKAKFRAYDSYESAFRDYARLINSSPRYAQARTQTHSAAAYASGLQQAGYATDPGYAAKLSQAINHTLRLQRVQA
jgi:flagellar protein FlgJ